MSVFDDFETLQTLYLGEQKATAMSIIMALFLTFFLPPTNMKVLDDKKKNICHSLLVVNMKVKKGLHYKNLLHSNIIYTTVTNYNTVVNKFTARDDTGIHIQYTSVLYNICLCCTMYVSAI